MRREREQYFAAWLSVPTVDATRRILTSWQNNFSSKTVDPWLVRKLGRLPKDAPDSIVDSVFDSALKDWSLYFHFDVIVAPSVSTSTSIITAKSNDKKSLRTSASSLLIAMSRKLVWSTSFCDSRR